MANQNPRDANFIPVLGAQSTLSRIEVPLTAIPLVGGSTPINGLTIAIVDGSGNQITTFGGGVTSSGIVGQKKITASAVQLPSNTLTNGVIFTALSTNTGNIFIGGSGVTTTADGTGNGYILEPGSSVSAAINNTNVFYVIGTLNDVLSFIGN